VLGEEEEEEEEEEEDEPTGSLAQCGGKGLNSP
jgi:hypothetical protein